MNAPRVTVLMPVYNGERYIEEAIQSILAQTLTDFELLIVEDGSTDRSPALIAGFEDARIRVIANPGNCGLVASLNTGLNQALGTYVARMDCDDVSFPERLARQVAYLDAHPEVGLCGSWFERHREGVVERVRPATDDADIRFWLLFKTVFLHSSVMLRRALFVARGLRYTDAHPHAEDYALWVQASRFMRLANVPDYLVAYRCHPDNTSSRHPARQQLSADEVTAGYLRLLDQTLGTDELECHPELVRFRTRGDRETVQRCGAWLQRLARLVETRLQQPGHRVYDQLQAQWYAVCGKAAREGWPIWAMYRRHPAGQRAVWHRVLRLGVRCLLRQPIPVPKPASALNPAAAGNPDVSPLTRHHSP